MPSAERQGANAILRKTLLSRFGEKVGKEPSQGVAHAPAREAFPLAIPQARRLPERSDVSAEQETLKIKFTKCTIRACKMGVQLVK